MLVRAELNTQSCALRSARPEAGDPTDADPLSVPRQAALPVRCVSRRRHVALRQVRLPCPLAAPQDPPQQRATHSPAAPPNPLPPHHPPERRPAMTVPVILIA